MKLITPILSPEQKRAKNQYQMAIVPIGLATFLGFTLLEVLVLIILDRLNIVIGSSGSLIFLPFMFGAFLLAHILAVRKVRLAGLSLESKKIEVVLHMENNYRGEPMEWCVRPWLVWLGNASLYLFFCAVAWLLWHFPWEPPSAMQKVVGIVRFWMFLWIAMVELILGRAPRIRIDQDGIVAFQNLFWRRRAHWADIAKCEIFTITNFLGQGPTRLFYFQSATGKIRLRLLPALFAGALEGLSRDEQAEIEREIKQRLGGEIQSE